jgi:flavin-binding protein dodecin
LRLAARKTVFTNQRSLAGSIERVDQTLNNIEGAWIKEQKVEVSNGKINTYRVNMLVTFILKGDE